MAIPVCEKWLTLQRTTCPHFVKPERVRGASTASRGGREYFYRQPGAMNSHTTNAYPITKEVYNYLLPVYERGRFVEKA